MYKKLKPPRLPRVGLLRYMALGPGLAILATVIALAVTGATFAFLPLAAIVPAWLVPLIVLKRNPRTDILIVQLGTLLAVIVAALAALWYWIVLVEHDRGMLPYSSPCGASPCSRQQNQAAWPFAPSAFFPDRWGRTNPFSTNYITCPCVGCAWGGDNGEYPPIIGFGSPDGFTINASDPLPSGGLASPTQFQLQTNAYPNPAYGLKYGWSIGATVNDLAFCPGQGQPVCPRCLQYFRLLLNYQNLAYNTMCPATIYAQEDVTFWCWFCPWPTRCAHVRVYAWCYTVVLIMFLVLWLLSLCNTK